MNILQSKQDLLAQLDLEPAQLIIIRSNLGYLLIIGAIFLILILCYYFSDVRKKNQIIKILKLVEKKPNKIHLILGLAELKSWLSFFDVNYAAMTELETAKLLRIKNMFAMANYFEATTDYKYQYRFDETNFSNILVSKLIAEIKYLKNAKSVLKIKL
jgi:hypothetical protein